MEAAALLQPAVPTERDGEPSEKKPTSFKYKRRQKQKSERAYITASIQLCFDIKNMKTGNFVFILYRTQYGVL
jgi:hypothetical protein